MRRLLRRAGYGAAVSTAAVMLAAGLTPGAAQAAPTTVNTTAVTSAAADPNVRGFCVDLIYFIYCHVEW